MSKLKIGNVELENNIILAPMAGVSDLPFRLLCKEQGAGLLCMEMVSAKALSFHNKNTENFKEKVANSEWQWDVNSEIQQNELARLPKEYDGLPNGHMGTHKLLIDDFCKAVYEEKMPILNAWFAARVNIPGLVAIESAKQGGIPLEVPDCGDVPEK